MLLSNHMQINMKKARIDKLRWFFLLLLLEILNQVMCQTLVKKIVKNQFSSFQEMIRAMVRIMKVIFVIISFRYWMGLNAIIIPLNLK